MDELRDNITLNEFLLKLLDGVLSDKDFELLEKHLHERPDGIEYYGEFAKNYAALRQPRVAVNQFKKPNNNFVPSAEELLREAIEEDEIIRAEREATEVQRQAEAKREAVKKEAEETFEKFKEEERRRQEKLAYKRYKARQRRLVFSTMALAASLILAACAWIYQYLSPLPSKPVASISESTDAQWARADFPTDRGTQLFTGSMHLLKGFVEITFDKGAKVILEAPAKIELEDAAQMFLHKGRLSARVPPYAYGFTINTPLAAMRDIGTEFGVKVDGNGGSELHVFNGEVILYTGGDNKNKTTETRQIVRDRQARRVNSTTKTIDKIALDESGYIHSWEELLYKIHTTGAVKYIRIIPPSLQPNTFEDDDHIRIFWERKGYILENDVTVADFIDPGIFQSFTYSKKQDKIIPAGTKVDSCLIHIDRVHPLTGNDRVRMTGSVTFARPVLGIIVSWKQLEATDAQLGAPETIYKDDTGQWTSSRGIIEGGWQNDILSTSTDRRTLNLDFTLQDFDQVRVLIEAPSD